MPSKGFCSAEKLAVVINDVPYRTDRYLRIPYTVKMWDFKSEGLVLEKIVVYDMDSNATLMALEKKEIPKLAQFKNAFYVSLQIPVPLDQAPPVNIYHHCQFRQNGQEVTANGAIFSPRLEESPMVISPPVRGDNWWFMNQSTMKYHFDVLYMVKGGVKCGERFAVDAVQLDNRFEDTHGHGQNNEAYYCYKAPLYAVADGTVIRLKDGVPENHGEGGPLQGGYGNYLILDMGGGRYATYAHCVPGAFRVREGDAVQEGQEIALLGNSGESSLPHLHFHISDGRDGSYSNGLPFVFKKYRKLGELGKVGFEAGGPYQGLMMEEPTVVGFGE